MNNRISNEIQQSINAANSGAAPNIATSRVYYGPEGTGEYGEISPVCIIIFKITFQSSFLI